MTVVPVDNPLLEKPKLTFESPDFSQIKLEHLEEAIVYGMTVQLNEVDELVKSIEQPEDATFENLIEKLELTGEVYERASTIFNNLASSDSSAEVRDVEDRLSPLFAKHHDDFFLNNGLFQRVQHVYSTSFHNVDKYSLEQRRLIEHYYIEFKRSGAMLTNDQQGELRRINEEYSSLNNTFQQILVVLDEESGFVTPNDNHQLDGLSKEDLERYHKDALSDEKKELVEMYKSQHGIAADSDVVLYVLPFTNTTRQPVLTELKNRATREAYLAASRNRGLASHFNGKHQTTPLLKSILLLRAKKAALLGYQSWAHFVLETEMPKYPELVVDTLKKMVPTILKGLDQEKKRINVELTADGVGIGDPRDVEPFDWEYYAEIVRLKEYNVNEEKIKPYCSFNNVMHKALFFVMGKLFNIRFVQCQTQYSIDSKNEENKDGKNDKKNEEKNTSDKVYPIYHKDVLVYEIYDNNNTDDNAEPIALFYADYFKRTGKSGGAWFTPYVTQNNQTNQRLVGVNVMNNIKSDSVDINDKTTWDSVFIRFDDISTFLHEFGHYMHGKSVVNYKSLSGTNTSTTFVEFPSTFHEDWVFHPEVLSNFATHYQTGEQIPTELVQSIVRSKTFNQGFELLEYISSSIIDLSIHMLDEPQLNELFNANSDIDQVFKQYEVDALKSFGIDEKCVPPRYHIQYFSHIFGGGYSSLYFAYLWSEILAADSFDFINKNGGLTEANGTAFRECILDVGNTREPRDSFALLKERITGQKQQQDGVNTDPLLARRGLLQYQ